MPASLPLVGGWTGLKPASSPLVIAQSFILWAGQAMPYSFSLESSLSLSVFFFFFLLSLSLFFFSFSLSLSLAIPQFGLLSHVSSLRWSSGHSGQVLTLMLADVSNWATSPQGVEVRHEFCVCVCVCVCFPLLVMLPSEIPKLPQTRRWEGFLVFGNLASFKTLFPRWVSVCNSFVSLFIFYILSYLLSKGMGYLSECLVSSASVQKLFCGICSAFKWFFNEFVGEKVVSLSYSSAILGPPPGFPI